MKRTKEHQEKILERVKFVINEKNLTQKQLEEITGISQADWSSYLKGRKSVADGFIYTIILKFSINPQWLENGEGNVYLLPSVEQNNTGSGTQINNINGDNNVSMTLPKEAWEMLQSQQRTIESQQQSVNMAQTNMLELIKTFNK